LITLVEETAEKQPGQVLNYTQSAISSEITAANKYTEELEQSTKKKL
jgi:hypothetical protein